MTVTVRLPDGGSVQYMRFGDAYVKHNDGTLDVVRIGVKGQHRYVSGQWTEVEGDEKGWKKRRLWG
ncbi:hypothetical protein ORI20_21470 [Mycobacterium sp. CVI_P3]|uniref:Uncharacterized protein n=1 Tax=Mycobacterium pinniadriaticum TaxID=2994102 RepID=A0ABT3SIB5_9MYCO|nr:hypothetical protein [Mycobacterium pinniadriaticum]MCX2932847.1 hypothetical protein [Mycobacterium pinniadriaticum]MCX2939271.1 hypothetical protein [Mycobacterium pinniadriaticum]